MFALQFHLRNLGVVVVVVCVCHVIFVGGLRRLRFFSKLILIRVLESFILPSSALTRGRGKDGL